MLDNLFQHLPMKLLLFHPTHKETLGFLKKKKRVRSLASFFGLPSAAFYLPLGVKNGDRQLTVGNVALSEENNLSINVLSNTFRAHVIWISSFLYFLLV